MSRSTSSRATTPGYALLIARMETSGGTLREQEVGDRPSDVLGCFEQGEVAAGDDLNPGVRDQAAEILDAESAWGHSQWVHDVFLGSDQERLGRDPWKVVFEVDVDGRGLDVAYECRAACHAGRLGEERDHFV